MRQTLFRIHTDSLWSFAPIDGVTGIGAIVLLLAWVAYGAYMVWVDRKQGPGRWSRLAVPAVTWVVVAVALLSLPAWASSRLPNGIPVFGYGVMVFCGFVAGGLTALRRARRVGIEADVIWDLLTWFFVAGIGGARLFYLVQKNEVVFAGVRGPADAAFRAINLSDGGLVLLGGVLAVVTATILFCRRRGIPTMLLADLLVPSFFIGLAFGRIGCLFNGCCFGDRCELPWGLHFPAHSVPWMTLVHRGFLGPEAASTFALHPTQIYSAITALGLSVVTAAYFWRRPYNGSVLVLGMWLYSIKRIVIEFLRGDELGQFGTIFTISQWISAAIFLAGVVLWVYLWFCRQNQASPVSRQSVAPVS